MKASGAVIVRKACTLAGSEYASGDYIEKENLRDIKMGNLKSLFSQGFLVEASLRNRINEEAKYTACRDMILCGAKIKGGELVPDDVIAKIKPHVLLALVNTKSLKAVTEVSALIESNDVEASFDDICKKSFTCSKCLKVFDHKDIGDKKDNACTGCVKAVKKEVLVEKAKSNFQKRLKKQTSSTKKKTRIRPGKVVAAKAKPTKVGQSKKQGQKWKA